MRGTDNDLLASKRTTPAQHLTGAPAFTTHAPADDKQRPALVLPNNPHHVRGGGIIARETSTSSSSASEVGSTQSMPDAGALHRIDSNNEAGDAVDQMIPLQECSQAMLVPLLHRHLEMQALMNGNKRLFHSMAESTGEDVWQACKKLWTETTRQEMPDMPWLYKTRAMLQNGKHTPASTPNSAHFPVSSSPNYSYAQRSPSMADCVGKHHWAAFCDVVGFDPNEVLVDEETGHTPDSPSSGSDMSFPDDWRTTARGGSPLTASSRSRSPSRQPSTPGLHTETIFEED
jgi:hypothetical protein